MNKDVLAENIKRYCEAKGTKPTPACIAAGVGKDLLQNIRLGKKTEMWRIVDLALYLGVSTSDLIGDNHQEPQQAIAEVWARLDEVDRAQVLGFAKGLANAEKYIKTVPDSQTAV
ncbi:MAG: hypothetical protein IKM84_04430 [Oscillospiraceae bacterium]|nr:hypothetical protein [Oscillospiraceae bacterium]